ncbi:hypothetical protein [Stenotrophomonas sp.]|uniref:hypothetical protein n=1 Tax=Stenotrophomonas sp. TaxID=69392 RepID=UPI003341F222
MADRSRHIKVASKSEAHLYVWGAIIDILEGSATPGRSDSRGASAVDQVVKIARKEQVRLLAAHDAALMQLSNEPPTTLATVKPPRDLRTRLLDRQ